MNQTPKKKQKLPKVDMDDVKIAEKVFGKRLKKELEPGGRNRCQERC